MSIALRSFIFQAPTSASTEHESGILTPLPKSYWNPVGCLNLHGQTILTSPSFQQGVRSTFTLRLNRQWFHCDPDFKPSPPSKAQCKRLSSPTSQLVPVQPAPHTTQPNLVIGTMQPGQTWLPWEGKYSRQSVRLVAVRSRFKSLLCQGRCLGVLGPVSLCWLTVPHRVAVRMK